MKDFTFEVLGIDYLPSEESYGMHFCHLDTDFDGGGKSLFGFYYLRGTLIFDLLYLRFSIESRFIK